MHTIETSVIRHRITISHRYSTLPATLFQQQPTWPVCTSSCLTPSCSNYWQTVARETPLIDSTGSYKRYTSAEYVWQNAQKNLKENVTEVDKIWWNARLTIKFVCNCKKCCICEHLEWRDSISYLGVTLLSGKCIKTDCNMLKRKFCAACNCVFSNCYNVSEVVQLQLQESYCLPILTYAAPALNLCDRQLRECECVLEWCVP